MPKQVIDKPRLIDAAYTIAEEEGLSALSIRKLAAACSISIGSVYTYFPTKADLVFAVVERFFARSIVEDFCRAEPDEGFVRFIRRFKTAMDELMGEYASTWLTEIQTLPRDERERGREAALARLGHMRHGLVQVLRTDPRIAPGVLVGPLDPEALASFVTDRLIAALRDKEDLDTLFALLERALYSAHPSE
ncbi:TetR/AcrR family transcriptional regulator [Schaalia hyovaginalis]|uniref:AcrR family transcriptional regulator n=2 Tax=Schaalia hyovaginalis TaxID=29316 RepID=A0A923IWI6_9ACTO|nr:TetR/AcrR family transcriptional regulator [Schaalia hyovaginalis]MBB6334162.1 AcrR family transcriptional regulator [Schaalia hyovaginalis]